MMDQKIQAAIKDKIIIEGLDLIANPPFIAIIMEYQRPFKFKPSTLDSYDETKTL